MPHEWGIWPDVHLSPAIAKWMKDYTGFSVKSSYILSFQNLDDLEIYQRAEERGNIILISKDADFPELISKLGAPPKLINLKIGNCDNKRLWTLLKPNIKQAIDLLISSDADIVEME